MRLNAIAAIAGVIIGWFLATDMDKSQTVRLLDVFVIGPLVVGSAIVPEKTPREVYPLLAFIGGATIGYNWRNYVRNQSLKTEGQTP